MSLDPSKFPRASRYLEVLPAGLDSYPECQMQASIQDDLRQQFPAIARAAGLPAPLLDALNGRHQDGWYPEVVGNALFLLVRDLAVDDDGQFLAWHHGAMARLFEKPLFRALMLVLSPTLVIMGAANRWHHFHRGTDLGVAPVTRVSNQFSTVATLTNPPEIFTELILRMHCLTFQAALEASRAKEPAVTLREATAAGAQFEARWQS